MNSRQYFERARSLIPGGVNSPVRAFKHVGLTPVYFSRAEGPYLYDVEGRQYIDFCGAFGPHILGHCHPTIVKAVRHQADRAMAFGTCHPQELEIAEWILKGFPFMENVRLVNSGTEAVMTAIRLARAVTGRNKILKFEGCYHGHSDGLLVKAGSGVAHLSEASSKGVPASLVQDTVVAKYFDFDSVETILSAREIAAVILEPIAANCGLRIPPRAHLKGLCDAAKSKGSLVIFDEVITGFRLGFSGGSGIYDLKPDLVTLGKVIGGGLPLAAVAGPKKIMGQLAPEGPVYQAGTFSGNPLGVAAGCAVLRMLFEENPYSELTRRTENFCSLFEPVIGRGGGRIIRIGSVFWIDFTSDNSFPPRMEALETQAYAELFGCALAHGIYLPPSPYEVCFISTAHTEAVLGAALEKLAQCLN